MKRPQRVIEGEGIRLRPLAAEDLPLALAWRNLPDVRRWYFDPGIRSPEEQREWYAAYRDRDNDFAFVIEEVAADGSPVRSVGLLSLYDIDWLSGRGEFGRLTIGEADARGRGIGFAATRLLLTFAFNTLELEEIVLTVLPGNVPAIRIYERCGFAVVSADDSTIVMRLTKKMFSSRRS